MPPSIGWYLLGPVLALLGVLAAVLRSSTGRDTERLLARYADGLDLFTEDEDYGLLSAAALAEDAEVAQDVRRVLSAAGIRSTTAVGSDGLITVLVFADQVDAARRLVGGSPGWPYPEA